ncbi:MAG: putative manganese transporter [Gemmatimonadota bacterium]
MTGVPAAILDALVITAFVAVMMIAVEYLNVLTRGAFEKGVRGAPAVQYGAAVLLGALPGCLGAFTVVALYTHRMATIGALVGAMIATFGDEAFVMLALVPRTALWLMAGLAAVGFVVAPVVDRVAGSRRYAPDSCARLSIHAEACRCFPGREILTQWVRPAPHRPLLLAGMTAFTLWVVLGGPGVPPAWSWVRVTLTGVALFGAFVVATVPDHFLAEHLWSHVARHHVPRIFAWTAGVLAGLSLLEQGVGVEVVTVAGPWTLLPIASLVGLVP